MVRIRIMLWFGLGFVMNSFINIVLLFYKVLMYLDYGHLFAGDIVVLQRSFVDEMSFLVSSKA